MRSKTTGAGAGGLARAAAVLLASGLVALALEEPAEAQCDCVCPAHLPRVVTTAVGGEIGPTPRLFARLDGYDPGTLTLTSDAGLVAPVAVEPAGDATGTGFWVVPTAPLSPGMYLLSVAVRGGPGRYEQALEVTATPDTLPPMAPSLGVVPLGGGRSPCEALVGGYVTWSPSPGVAAEAPAVIEVELSRRGVMFARVFPFDLHHFGTSPSASCFATGQVGDLVDGEELTARVRGWDLAGNVTDWSESPFTVGRDDGPTENCARCSASPGGGSAAGAMGGSLALLLALARRRRARP